MAQETLLHNIVLPIKNSDGTSFHNLELRKYSVDSVVMSLGDKITGDVYYPSNTLQVTMKEYVEYEGVKYVLVSPPTIVREGLVKDNSDAKGMTKYSFVFYHPMYMLGNFPFTDIAVTGGEEDYLSQDKSFSWIGTLFEFIAKLNANLKNTEWFVDHNIEQYEAGTETETLEWGKAMKNDEVLSFDKQFISEALKKAYEYWEIPFTITSIDRTVDGVAKKFLVEFGLPSQEILDANNQPFVFRFGQGVGLKNNSRTPKNNKIITRLVGYGAERNIPYGYPQIVWTGDQTWKYTINNSSTAQNSYPIYDGIVGGQKVKLIKHPFTRKNLMPSIYAETVNKKVNPFARGYNPDEPIIDYIDATQSSPKGYPNPINPLAPSVEIHQFEDEYPHLDENTSIIDVMAGDGRVDNGVPFGVQVISDATYRSQINTYKIASNNENEKAALEEAYTVYKTFSYYSVDYGSYVYEYQKLGAGTYQDTDQSTKHWYYVKYTSGNVNFEYVVYDGVAAPQNTTWDDSMDDDGNYLQSYFRIKLPQLSFDLYACASITEAMNIVMRSGACMGCSFPVEIDWEDYKANFYHTDGTFDPLPHTTPTDGHVRDMSKYPDSSQGQITVIVKKDLDTFGTLMPNRYQYPKGDRTEGSGNGDKIVFTGVSLPLSYITAAQTKLDDTMEEYMLENNVHHYDYPLKFDEFFLRNNANILAQIKNNNIVRFEFAGLQNALYIKQITVKYRDAELPQFDITLTDDVEIVLNSIGQVTDDVSRIRVQLNELQKYYGENIVEELAGKLSRLVDDVCMGRISFQQGLDSLGSTVFHDEVRSPQFQTGLYDGKGWRIDNLGNAEFESARVRSFLEVVELLVNRMQAQEGDTVFSDNDQIDRVDKYVDPTDSSVSYVLSLKEKWNGYITAQMYGNVLKGIINTLAAHDSGISDVDTNDLYFTSWMRVIATHSTDNTLGVNQIRVVLYGDNETPAGRNFEPCELMTIARWGNVLNPEQEGISDSEKARRRALQSSFYISTSEGRIAKLTNVNKPILENWNYGTTLGILPDFVQNYSTVRDRIIAGRDYLYAQGVVVGDFIKVDIEGRPIPTVTDQGEWQTNTPYLCNEFNDATQQYETHRVRHNGGTWQCLQSQPVIEGGVATYYEPKWNSPYWMLVDGNDNLTIEFVSSKGYSFRRGAVNTDITPHLFYGNVDITSDVAAEYWNWTRESESGKTIQDETWDAQHQHMKDIHLANIDMPQTWSTQDKAIFTCTVTLNDGKTTRIVDNQIIS